MNIDTIVFDLGGVLIDWNPRYVFKNIFKEEEEMEYFLTEVCKPSWNHQMDEGKPFAEAVEELTKEFPKYALDIKAYHERWDEMLSGTINGTVEILYKLTRSANFKMLALTNWSAETIPVAYRRYPLFSCFEGIVVSGDVKMAKPESPIFEHLIAQFSVNPSKAIFIDDSLPNIKTAESLGFNAIHFQSPDQLAATLNSMGIVT